MRRFVEWFRIVGRSCFVERLCFVGRFHVVVRSRSVARKPIVHRRYPFFAQAVWLMMSRETPSPKRRRAEPTSSSNASTSTATPKSAMSAPRQNPASWLDGKKEEEEDEVVTEEEDNPNISLHLQRTMNENTAANPQGASPDKSASTPNPFDIGGPKPPGGNTGSGG